MVWVMKTYKDLKSDLQFWNKLYDNIIRFKLCCVVSKEKQGRWAMRQGTKKLENWRHRLLNKYGVAKCVKN